MNKNREVAASNPIHRAILAADQILEQLGTADAQLNKMTAEVPLDDTELVDDINVVIPVLRISRLMGRLAVLPWSHEIDYFMASGETSRKVFLRLEPAPKADIMSWDISVNLDNPDHETKLSPSIRRTATSHEEEIVADDLSRVAGL